MVDFPPQGAEPSLLALPRLYHVPVTNERSPGGTARLGCRCEYYECTRQPTYGMDGHQAKFCSSHKEEGMVDVKNCRCKHPGCTRQPNYGHEGGRAKYCSSHKMSDMINVVSRRCEYPDCKRQVRSRRSACFFATRLSFKVACIIGHKVMAPNGAQPHDKVQKLQ